MDKTEAYRVPEALALDMAYAEHPYRELAAVALHDNNEPFSRATIKAGERAAAHVALANFGLFVDNPEQRSEAFALATNASVSRQDIIDFIIAHGSNEHDATSSGGRLWTTFQRFDMHKIHAAGDDTSGHTNSLPLQNLLHITRYYTEQSAALPHMLPSSILGTGWGAATVDLLNGFIARELQRIQNRQSV